MNQPSGAKMEYSGRKIKVNIMAVDAIASSVISSNDIIGCEGYTDHFIPRRMLLRLTVEKSYEMYIQIYVP